MKIAFKSLFLFAAFAMTWLSPHAATAADTAPWYERVSLTGDVRLRYETINAEGGSDQERGRYRGRLGLAAPLHETVRLVVRLATGDGSPVSTNLNFDDGFSSSNIRVDRAYVDWRINSSWSLQAGKMKSPWFRSGGNALLWDSDFNPKGIAATFKSERTFGSAAALRMEPGPAGDDSLLLAVQGGLKLPLGESRSLILGAGYYDHADTVGNVPFHNGSPGGNSTDATGNYRFDYAMLELFAQYGTTLGRMPASLFGAWVRNTAIGSANTAYALGVKVGSIATQGNVQFAYSWQDTEADAVVATFNDSDFAGGRTGASGHLLSLSYAVHQNVTLGATAILSKRVDSTAGTLDYDRVMLDLAVAFE